MKHKNKINQNAYGIKKTLPWTLAFARVTDTENLSSPSKGLRPATRKFPFSLSSLGERFFSLSSLGERSKIRGTISSLSSLGERSETRGSIRHYIPNQYRMLTHKFVTIPDSRFRKNDRQACESGRSMTEMLGVLAIIGILSIGAAAGYNYAINKHRANQILQDIRLIYQETKYPNTVQQIVNGGAFPDMEIDTQSAYEYSFTFPDLDDFIYDSAGETLPNLISVNVSGVPKTACDILLKNKPSYVLMLKANGESVWACDQEVNELNYIFEITSDSLDYGTCSVCTGEHCFDDDLNCPEGEYCYNDTCSKCAHGYTENKSDQCVQCSASWNGINTVDEENCLRCGDNAYSKYHKKCYSCDKMSNWETTLDECNECSHNPNVVAMKTTTTGHVGCFNCKNFGYYPWAEKAQCEKCMKYNENIIFYPKDANGTSTTGLCTVCTPSHWNTQKNADGTACECPTGQFWVFADGNHSFCRACTNTDGNGSRLSSKTECDKCPERYYNVAKGGNDRNGQCKLCPTGQVKDTSADGDGRRCVDAPTP